MDNRIFGNLKIKKKSWLHRLDPFQAFLRNRLNNTLGVDTAAKALFLPSALLNQGSENICSEDGSYTIMNTKTGASYVPGDYIAKEQSFTGNNQTTAFDAATVMQTAVLSGFKRQDGTVDQPAATLWIKPNNGMDLYDSIQAAINQAQIAGGCAAMWMLDWDGGANGIVPDAANNTLGGHWFTVSGKTPKTIATGIAFPEPDRMAVPNTWGNTPQTAPGSDSGYYYFNRQEVNAWFGNMGIGIWIFSTDRTIQILGRMSALYAKILTLMGLA